MANARNLKVTARQSAFAVVGSGTATITAYDMVHSSQTLDAANAVFTISDIVYDVNNSANITRGGNLIFACNAGQNEINLTDSVGAVLNDKATSNVTVNLGASEGTMIIQFTKGTGFIDQDRQNQGPGSL
jgi:hypothetical protein